jgi:hypothetical protein
MTTELEINNSLKKIKKKHLKRLKNLLLGIKKMELMYIANLFKGKDNGELQQHQLSQRGIKK